MIPSKIKALAKGECFGWEFKPQRKTFGQNTWWGVEIAFYSLVLCRQCPTLVPLIQETDFGFAMECLVISTTTFLLTMLFSPRKRLQRAGVLLWGGLSFKFSMLSRFLL